MTVRARLFISISAVSVVAACSAASNDPPGKSAIPNHHRPMAAACAATPLPAEPTSVPAAPSGDAGGIPADLSRECATHADCTAAANGRCVGVTDCNPSTATCGTHCVYEQCTHDDDCGSASVCFCSNDSTFCAAGYARFVPAAGYRIRVRVRHREPVQEGQLSPRLGLWTGRLLLARHRHLRRRARLLLPLRIRRMRERRRLHQSRRRIAAISRLPARSEHQLLALGLHAGGRVPVNESGPRVCLGRKP